MSGAINEPRCSTRGQSACASSGNENRGELLLWLFESRVKRTGKSALVFCAHGDKKDSRPLCFDSVTKAIRCNEGLGINFLSVKPTTFFFRDLLPVGELYGKPQSNDLLPNQAQIFNVWLETSKTQELCTNGS